MRSRRRPSRSLILLAALLTPAACADEDDDDTSDVVAHESAVEPADESTVASIDGRPPVGLHPGMTWQWQLQGDIDTSYDVDLYDVDLFDTPTDTIDELHHDGRIVICYFSTAYEDWRDDAPAWPARALGSPLDDWAGERWVDIRDDGIRDVLLARLDMAAARGCDGVEPDNVTAYRNDGGFDLTIDDQLEFNRFLADEAHRRGLSIGLKNALELIPDLVGSFDFAVNEQCAEYGECDVYAPFVDAGKPVFGAEYSDHAVENPDAVCAVAEDVGISMLILPLELDGTFRLSC